MGKLISGKLSTHILDTSKGKPAAGVKVELFKVDGFGESTLVTETKTNADGRTDQPILHGEAFEAATYILHFHIGEYFGEGLFDVVPIRFVVQDASANYHVPLVCTPWSYSTYRGS